MAPLAVFTAKRIVSIASLALVSCEMFRIPVEFTQKAFAFNPAAIPPLGLFAEELQNAIVWEERRMCLSGLAG
jgi:hypothetical protein